MIMPANTTRCPHCTTTFRVTAEQLESAGGIVRCGKCIGVFNALDHQLDHQLEPARQSLVDTLSAEVAASVDPETIEQAMQQETSPRLTELIHNEFSDQPSKPMGPNNFRSLAWKATALLLGALLLGAQYSYFFSAQISTQKPFRDAITLYCQYLGCKVAPFSDIRQLQINELVIRADSEYPGAILVDVLIKNTAQQRQPYPNINLRFDNWQNQTIGERLFRPQEYLSTYSTKAAPALTPGHLTRIRFRLVDPGPEAVNYRAELQE